MGAGIAEIFHDQRNVPRGLLSKIHANIEIRIRHISTLLISVETSCTIQRFDVEEYKGSVEDIARIARAKWASSRGPVVNLTKTLENIGIIVVPMDFETTKLAVISRWLPTLPPVFFVNERCYKDQLRVAMAHELGHLVMHESPNPDIEDEADRFAAEFLMPEREIYNDLQDLDIAKLANLKRYWKISMLDLLKRAEALEAMTARQRYYLQSKMTQVGYKRREPIELDVTGEESSLLYEIIEMHRNELGYSTEDLCQILAINENDLWSMYLKGHDVPALKLIKSS
jgi:Zn-dependent peptidase ImmA (M78 family)